MGWQEAPMDPRQNHSNLCPGLENANTAWPEGTECMQFQGGTPVRPWGILLGDAHSHSPGIPLSVTMLKLDNLPKCRYSPMRRSYSWEVKMSFHPGHQTIAQGRNIQWNPGDVEQAMKQAIGVRRNIFNGISLGAMGK